MEHDVLSVCAVRIVADLDAGDALSFELLQRLLHVTRWVVDRTSVHSDGLRDRLRLYEGQQLVVDLDPARGPVGPRPLFKLEAGVERVAVVTQCDAELPL